MEHNPIGPVKNFRVLHVSKKSAAVITVCQMPFFFIALFLFKHHAIIKIQGNFLLDLYFYFILCLCFCLSLTWSLMNVITTYVIIAITNNGEKEPTEPHEKYISTIIYSFVYLSCIIVFGYMQHFQIESFLLLAYSFILVMIAWRFITVSLSRKNNS